MAKSKDQKLLEFRERMKVLERKNARLEKELEVKDRGWVSVGAASSTYSVPTTCS
jgi:hypothetical protein